MTNPAKIPGRLLILLSLALSGCASWTGNHSNRIVDTDDALKLPSAQFRPSVRGKAPETPSATQRVTTQTTQPTSADAANAKQDQLQDSQSQDLVIRGQQPDGNELDYNSEYGRGPLPVSGVASRPTPSSNTVSPVQYTEPAQYTEPGAAPPVQPTYGSPGYGPPSDLSGVVGYPDPAGMTGAELPPGSSNLVGPQPYNGRLADLVVNVQEQQTGRFMFGVGVNSDAGLTAQVVVDEYNFDWKRFPHSVDDILNGTAWRGGGQRLRIEAIPGSVLQRYLVNFTEPYLFDSRVSLNLSGFLYDRRYFDWDEQRLGGRIGLGYRITPDLSISSNMRLENVNIRDPRVRGVEQLEAVLGDNSLYSGRMALTHDTRDSPFAATEGHLLELSFEYVFGTFEYPRGVVDYRRYFLLSERPDGSGRHTLGTSIRLGLSGEDTPLYENFFAGGYSTIRGFRFRGASPKDDDVVVGGRLSLLGSVEYMFPVTADDMLKGVVFCDYGTVEEEVEIHKDDFRVAVGAGLRVAIPAMGPAPIALDLAVPIAREQTDQIQNFSFFVGFGR